MKIAIVLAYEVAAALILATCAVLALTSIQEGITGDLFYNLKVAILVVLFFMGFSGFILAMIAVGLSISPAKWKLKAGILIAGLVVSLFVFAIVAGEDFSYQDFIIFGIGIPIIALAEFSASRFWGLLAR